MLFHRAFPYLLLALAATVFAQAAGRDVDLTASDGAKLKVSYFPADEPGPGVLLLHQCNRDRKVWDSLAQQMSAAGLNVLTLDLRGFGESAGVPLAKATPEQANEERAKWPDDIDVAFRYLVSLPGVRRDTIGVGGASCGVNNAIQAAMRHPEVRSLVLLSGPTDYKGRGFLRADSKVPALYAYADDDEFPPSIVSIQWLYSITADPDKSLVSYKTGGHGADIFKVHPELMGLITDWCVTTLIKTPGKAPAAKQTMAIPEQVKILTIIDEPDGAAKVEAQLQAARRQDPKVTLFSQETVNVIGYEHLRGGDTKGAVEIMKLNVAAYPNSANAHDSLGDAYLADGKKELAIQNARKALELLPSDTVDDQQRKDAIKTSAEEKLKQLGAVPQ